MSFPEKRRKWDTHFHRRILKVPATELISLHSVKLVIMSSEIALEWSKYKCYSCLKILSGVFLGIDFISLSACKLHSVDKWHMPKLNKTTYLGGISIVSHSCSWVIRLQDLIQYKEEKKNKYDILIQILSESSVLGIQGEYSFLSSCIGVIAKWEIWLKC